MRLSEAEISRYNRQIIMDEVGIRGQEKLKKSKVLVVGAGGLGCPALQSLTAAGVGKIAMVDFDIIDESNLHRQVLYNHLDIGKPKVSIAYEKLSLMNPNIEFFPINERLTKNNVLHIFKDFDIIVDGTDNFATRYLINDACIILNKPWVFGAIHKFMGQASVFNYKNGPTYRCLFPEQPEMNETPNCSTIGVLGTIPGIIGNIQANEVLKIILEKDIVLSGILLQIDFMKFKIEQYNFTKNPKSDKISELGEYNDYCIDDPEREVSITAEKLYNTFNDLNEVIVFDIRDKGAFRKYKLKDSLLITVDALLYSPNYIPKNKKVIIVCEYGIKSLSIASYFQNKLNLPNVFSLEGGIQSYSKYISKINKSETDQLTAKTSVNLNRES